MPSAKEKIEIMDKRRQEVKKLHLQGLVIREISEATNISTSTITKDLKVLIANNEIPPIEFKRGGYRPPLHKRSERLSNKVLEPGETIACTLEVSRHCIYGTQQNADMGKCNYILCTGKIRDCKPSACNKFIAAKKGKKAKQIV